MDASSEAFEEIRGLINDSPFYKYMGMKVVEAADGRSKLVMKLKPEMHNLYSDAAHAQVAGHLQAELNRLRLGLSCEAVETQPEPKR